jgi:hypothetical protein|tara:strand:- start:2942 stop:3112 length:171 start_codon:yes stop_codon:yes gene_type:complete
MTKWHGGKGSKQRPTNKNKWSLGWDKIFKNKKTTDITKLKNVWEEKSTKKEKQNDR